MATAVNPNGADLQATPVLNWIDETGQDISRFETCIKDFDRIQETAILEEETSQLNTKEANKGAEMEVCESEYPELAGIEVRNVVILSVSYFCVASAYLALRNLQGSLNDENGLGVASLSCLYGISIVSALLAPVCISFLGLKTSIIGSFAAFLVYVLSNFYLSFVTLIPASLLCGGAAGPLWTAQGAYVSACAFSFAKGRDRTLHSVLSKFNGIFWSIMGTCVVSGNLVSSLILYQSNYETAGANASIYCGANDCPRNVAKDIIDDPEPITVYILLGVFLAFVAIGIVLSAVFLTPVRKEKQSFNESLKGSLLACVKVIKTTDLIFALAFLGYKAIAVEFVVTEITKSFVSCPFGIRNVGYIMMAYGGCSALAAFVFGRLGKYIKRPYMLIPAFVCQFALLLWLINWIPQTNEIILVYIVVVVWGLSDGVIRLQQFAMLAELFPRDLTAVFAVNQASEAFCFTLAFMYSNLICMKVKIVIAIVALLIGTCSYCFAEWRFVTKQNCIKT